MDEDRIREIARDEFNRMMSIQKEEAIRLLNTPPKSVEEQTAEIREMLISFRKYRNDSPTNDDTR